jgi:hypothetical protein
MDPRASTWAELSEQERDRYQGRIGGIYGHEGDEAAYNALANDKQEALKLISGRLIRTGLWQYVGRIVNVYGVGGVGMYFGALGDLDADLERRREFTRWFARHHDNSGGFLERGRKHASLHFLYIDPPAGERQWHVHLDLYGGWGSVITAVQHLYWERLRKYRPDWRIMRHWAD